eukprot:NODE_232_length_13679_cov_0.197349.p2 type:complete len:555 gc:universal NODE_232_length_13679_cov_0.197349:2218-554(-)
MLLGKGSSSSVYLLSKNNSKCALKTNPSKREVQFLRTMSHPNIIQFLNTHPQGILLEACIGDLQHIFDSHNNMSFMFDLWIYQLCNALSYLQSIGIIHRDVKLANILLNEQYDVKLNDFGLAVNTNETVELSGTPNYLAPELLLNREAPSHKSDVFAAGVCCFALLTGTLPFEGGTAKKTMTNIIQLKWQPNLIPLPYKKFVSNMMKSDPHCRSNASDLLSGTYFFNLFNPLETLFISPFVKSLQNNKIAVLKTGDILIQQPSCAVHVNGSVTLLPTQIVDEFFDSESKCLDFDANALYEVFSNYSTFCTTQLPIKAKMALRIALDASNKLVKRFHSIMIQGNSFDELCEFKVDSYIKVDSSWRAALWKNDDFHFRSADRIIRFVRSSEVIEIYEPISDSISNAFIYQLIHKCSVRGIPNEYKSLITLAQSALKKCLLHNTSSKSNYQSYKSIEHDVDLPIYHPSSEYVDNVGWLIQIPGDKGNMTVELLSVKGERVRIVDDFVFTWNLYNIENSPMTKNLEGILQLGPQRLGYNAYLKSEIPDYVKWFIQKFR